MKLKLLALLSALLMGAMHTWMWGERYPDFMDAPMPLASNPVEIAGRNRVYRKMISDLIRHDPEWQNGEYKTQPRGLIAALYLSMMAGSSPWQWQKQYPNREAADKFLEEELRSDLASADANDTLIPRRLTSTPIQRRQRLTAASREIPNWISNRGELL